MDVFFLGCPFYGVSLFDYLELPVEGNIKWSYLLLGAKWICAGVVAFLSSCNSFSFLSPGTWSLLFRPMVTSVLLASTLLGIFNVFVFEKNMCARTKINKDLTIYYYNYKKMAKDSPFYALAYP